MGIMERDLARRIARQKHRKPTPLGLIERLVMLRKYKIALMITLSILTTVALWEGTRQDIRIISGWLMLVNGIILGFNLKD